MPLAFHSYAGLQTLDDDADVLNLAWTSDERRHLSVDVRHVVTQVLQEEIHEHLPYVQSYFVQDPYGERVLGDVVARYFALEATPLAVTCGAGVGPLLAGLVHLAAGAPIYVAGDVYPDLPHWAQRAGARCVTYADRTPQAVTAAAHADNALTLGARLVVLERPALVPDLFLDLAAVRELCERLERADILVMVDESNANYWPPTFSAGQLLDSAPNLVVARGLSKALGLGGLRLGYCMSRPEAAAALRAVTPPLLASSLSLRLGAAVLGLGDVTAPLRDRIRRHRAVVAGLLRDERFGTPTAASDFLPYLLFAERPERVLARLRELGVVGKLQPVWSAATGRSQPVCRISVPLDDARLDRLRVLARRAT